MALNRESFDIASKWSSISEAKLAENVSTTASPVVAILPAGAVETHGPHLPLGTDTIIAQRLLDHLEPAVEDREVSIVRLPALWIGASAEHAQAAGTVSVEPEILIANVMAVCEALTWVGAQRLIVFNAHGGNVAALAIAALKARQAHGLLVANVHWFDFGLPHTITPPAPIAEDVHGGWMETALMMHLAPELVALDRATPKPTRLHKTHLYPHGPVAWGWLTKDLVDGTWVGRPDLGTADLGRRMTEHIIENLAELVADVSNHPWQEKAEKSSD